MISVTTILGFGYYPYFIIAHVICYILTYMMNYGDICNNVYTFYLVFFLFLLIKHQEISILHFKSHKILEYIMIFVEIYDQSNAH